MRLNREAVVLGMLRLDLTGQELARRAGVSESTITAVRSGKSCSLGTGRKLAAVLGPEILQSMGGDDVGEHTKNCVDHQ